MILRENLICVWVMGRLLLYPYNSVVHCLIWWQHRCLCDLHSFLQNSFTDIYLTNAKTHGIIIKLSHESESWGNLGITGAVKRIGRSTVSGWGCSRKVHLTKSLKCGRMNRLTVLDRLSRKKEKENVEWTSVHKMFTWQNRQNVIKWKSWSRREGMKRKRVELQFTKCLLDKNF